MGGRSAAFSGGFSDPVFQSQAVFKALMDGMARPGTIARLVPGVAPPPPLAPAAGAIALTLCDQDTPVWLCASLARTQLPAWLSFHAGAPLCSERSDARFAFIATGAPIPGFDQFALGTQEYPDRSTTLVIEVEALDGGPELVATGPGIDGKTSVAPRGLPALFPDLWAENRAHFPRGIDLVLVAGNDCLCLPRTTRLTLKEA